MKSKAMGSVIPRLQGGVAARFIQDVRDRMEALGLTQQELAQRARVSQAQISKLLAGQHSPPLATVERIAKALKCNAELRLTDYS